MQSLAQLNLSKSVMHQLLCLLALMPLVIGQQALAQSDNNRSVEVTSADTFTAAKPAQRIVALAPHIVEMLFEIGAGDRIVATVEYANHPAAAKAIPRIGNHAGVSMEKLLSYQPDLVLFWQGGNQAQDLAKMRSLGLNVRLSDPKALEDVAKELVMLGELTGQTHIAQHRAEQFMAKLHHIEAQYQGKQALSVFYQLWSAPLMTINQASWINQLITSCNATNVFANAPTKTPQVSIENVLVAMPEVIVIPDASSAAGSKQPDAGWQQWPQIPAVKKQQIIHTQGDVMHRFSSNMLTGLADMCQQLDSFRE
ncbi:cobalamin-binding protein [Thalassotalea euphylliae]|nr:cobalamin-binding protein [Thalassotalea euphylliae]